MRNLKKLLAVLVVAAMMITVAMPVFAADSTLPADTKTCADIGMLKGPDANGVTADYATTQPSRLQAAILFLRLKGLEADALAFSGDNFSDSTSPVTAYLKAHPELGFLGIGDGKFDPDTKITAAQYYKVVLTAMGYKQDVDFKFADVVSFAASKGLTKVASVANFTIADLATATVEGLKATVNGGTDTLAATLIKAGKLDEAKATAAGVYTAPVPPAPAAVALDVSGASALTSKIVEVTLGTAAADADVAAAAFTVKDSAGKAIAVSSVAFAPYDTDKTVVLATLESDTTAGTLYTLTSGDKSTNFGGKAVDTAKPEIKSVASNDYNQVKIQFKEPIQLGGTVTIAEKYGTKAALAVNSIAYDGNDTILLSTADQKGSTLYGVTVDGFKDFSGNTMDSDSDFTFVGTKKNADDLVVNTAYGKNNPEEATVGFNVRVDAATLTPDNFKVEEMYGTKAVLPVTAVRVATSDDTSTDGVTALADDVVANSATDCLRFVVLTIPGTKDNTLYKVTVSNVKSAYGLGMSTDSGDNYKTFVGSAKPTDAYGYTVVGGAASDNTTVKLLFGNKVVQADAENIANYAIAEAYGAKAALAITKASLDSDGKTLTLTTAAMKSVLYKITVTGIKDIWGNGVDTDSDANIVSFSGKTVAPAIGKINSITYPDANDNTVIAVQFDQNVGDSCSDVSHYVIDNSIGYPIKAELGDTDNVVKLTIPELTQGTTYKLTVKGLENADNVAMDSDGVSKSFIGKGEAAGDPQIQGVVATDERTLKIIFDRDVTDSSIDGATKVWNDATYTLVAGALTVKGSTTKYGVAGSKDLASYVEYANQDATDKNVLNVRVDAADFIADNTKADGTFELDGSALFDSDYNTAGFAPASDDAAAITVDNILSLDKNSIRVYFNEPVTIVSSNWARVATTTTQRDTLEGNVAAAGSLALSNPTAVDDTNTVYDFALSGDLAAGSNYLVVRYDTTGALKAMIHDYTEVGAGYVTMADETDTTTNIDQNREFAGSTDAPSDIDSVSVMMTDARTMEIYYPEAMSQTGASSAIDKANYSIFKADKATAAITGANITDVAWDSDTNKVTMTFDQDLAASSAYYLDINKAVKNALGTKSVVDSGADVVAQFANSDTEAPLVSVTEATYDGAANPSTITLTLSQKAKQVGVDLTTAAGLVSAFDVTVVIGGTNHVLVAGDIQAVDPEDSDGATVNPANYTVEQIKITLNNNMTVAGPLDVNGVGEAVVKTAADLKGINGMAGDPDTSVDLPQK